MLRISKDRRNGRCKQCECERYRHWRACRLGDQQDNVVYFALAENTGLIKIGHSRASVNDRLNALQRFCAVRLALLGTIPGDVADERRIHRTFRHLRSHGEWFWAERSLMVFINNALGEQYTLRDLLTAEKPPEDVCPELAGTVRRCLTCLTVRPRSYFGKDTKSPDGLRRNCKLCRQRERRKARRQREREREQQGPQPAGEHD